MLDVTIWPPLPSLCAMSCDKGTAAVYISVFNMHSLCTALAYLSIDQGVSLMQNRLFYKCPGTVMVTNNVRAVPQLLNSHIDHLEAYELHCTLLFRDCNSSVFYNKIY